MARQSGVTTNTFSRFIIDAGAVYKNYNVGTGVGTLLGATRGGNSFSIQLEQREMEVDGARGPVKGGKRIVGINVSITANFLEMSDALLLAMNPAATSASYGTPQTHDLITRAADIADADFLDNITIVGNTTASDTNYIIIVLENALADGNFENSMTDKEESVIPVTFMGHFLPTDLVTEPWKIYNPIIS